MSNFEVMVFLHHNAFYFILSCFAVVSYNPDFFFLIRDKNGVDPYVRVAEEKLGGVEVGEILMRIHYMVIYF